MDIDPAEALAQPQEPPVPATVRASRSKPTRSLPTDRVSFEKQLVVLRAYAKASAAADGQPVSNADVAKYADVHPGSISSCNQFWNDVGLLAREGNKNRPDDAVVEFDQAAEWSPDKAGFKLARVLESAWFAQALGRKLALRSSISRSEAVEFLAEEARAGKEYRLHLEILLDYLRVAGLIVADGTIVSRPARVEEDAQQRAAASLHKGPTEESRSPGRPNADADALVERFSIPLPGKGSVAIEMPKDLDHDDWVMLSSMLAQYIRRWKKFKTPKELADATAGDDEPA
jgi:hypothetical protein